MGESRVFGSVAEVGEGIGELIARQMGVVFRRAMDGAEGVTGEGRFVRLVTGEAHPLGNFALVSDGGDAEGTREAAGALVGCGAPSAVFFLGGPVGEGVESYLRGEGFEGSGALPAMGVDMAELRRTSLPEGYVFERVLGGAEGDAWEEAFAAGYELPRRVAALFSPRWVGAEGADDAPIQFFAVRSGSSGRIVGTSMLALFDGLAGVYGVSTIPEERGKGLGAHATAAALRVAARLGYGVGVLQSSQMGESVYRGLGFEVFGGVPMYVRMGS